MRYKNFLLAVLLGVLLPWLLLLSLEPTIPAHEKVPEDVTEPQPQPDVLEIPVLLQDGSVRIMPMEEYLIGVMMGEIPASFEDEALKAQAVAARTFTCKSLSFGKHPNAAVCTDASCCQAYLTQEQYRQRGGRDQDIMRLRNAVEATADQVLCYDGELIIAPYFSCSGGTTEDAVAVWGMDIPYLQAVSSPGEENAAHYMDTVTFEKADFESKLNTSLSNGVGDYTYSDGGGVEEVRIGDKLFSGVQLRQLLQLRSTAFVIHILEDRVEVTTKGFGHRVGMSQYGANAMAVSGCSYKEILQYYYKGVTVEKFHEMMI